MKNKTAEEIKQLGIKWYTEKHHGLQVSDRSVNGFIAGFTQAMELYASQDKWITGEEIQSQLNKNFDNIRIGAEHALFINNLLKNLIPPNQSKTDN